MRSIVPSGGGNPTGPTQKPRSIIFQALAPAPGIVVDEGVRATVAVENKQVFLGPRLFLPPVTYNDSGTGTISLSGSATDDFSVQRFTVAIQGYANEGGTMVAVQTTLPTVRQPAYYPGAHTPALFNDSGTGTLTLTGSATETFTVVQTATVQVQGQTNQGENVTAPGAAAATGPAQVPVSRNLQGLPAGVPNFFTDSGTGTITFTGSATETFAIHAPFAVAIKGSTNQRGVTVQPDGAPGPEPKDPQPQTFFYYNSAPPTYTAIAANQTNQGYRMPKVIQPSGPDVGKPRSYTAKANVNYVDSGTGTVTFTGATTEAFAVRPVFAAQAASTLLVAKPVVSFTYDPLGASRRVTLPPPKFFDTQTGTLTFSGIGFDDFHPPGGTVVPTRNLLGVGV